MTWTARTRTLPDVLPDPGAPFDVLFCGINPGLYSAEEFRRLRVAVAGG